jgi:hypothetical protein
MKQRSKYLALAALAGLLALTVWAGKPGTVVPLDRPGASPAQDTIFSPLVPPCPEVPVAGLGPRTALPEPSSFAQEVKPPGDEGRNAAVRRELLASVLWDQPLSGVNQNAYVNQDFPDYPGYTSYLADDFTNPVPWSIGKIFIPGLFWNGGSSFTPAAGMSFYIYADAAGLPAGYPGDGVTTPQWTITLLPGNSQLAYSTGTDGQPSDVTLTLTTPIALPAGTWWFVWAPTMAFGSGGQYGRQPSDTTNGAVAKWINPGGGFGYGTAWQNWTVLGAAQHDLAFRLEAGGCVKVDNGPLVNFPAACGGMDASRLQTGLGMNTLGFGHQYAYGYRMADDFTIADAAGWDIYEIQFFAYQTGAGTTSTMTGVYLQIWDGPPNNPGSTVVWGDLTTNRMTSTAFSQIQRDSGTSPCANNRYIFRNTCAVGTHLGPGTYWLDWMTDGSLSSGPWAPPITINGQVTTGNALQYTGVWAPAIDSGTSTQQGMPFIILGGCCAGLTLAPAVLPSIIQGVPFSQMITASGGTAPYTFAVTGGTLPAGLTLDPGGLLSGTPAGSGGYSFTVTATDSGGCTGEITYTGTALKFFFLDSLGRSKFCVDTVTATYVWNITSGPESGTNLTGTAKIFNAGAKVTSLPGDPNGSFSVTYDAVKHKASGWLITAAGHYVALSDPNTTNNPGGCD